MYEMKDIINKIHCADCLDFMKGIPDNSVDLVLTDPPYGIGADIRQADSSGRTTFTTENRWDMQIPSKEYFDEIFRISKNQIIWGGNYFIEQGLTNSRCWLSWDKMQKFTGADMELAWTSFDSSSKVFRMSRVEFHGKEKKEHPTQKPLSLFKWCLAKFSEEGDIVLDPFIGSGTTARACKDLNRKYIGIELSSEYCKIAEKRLRQEVLL